MFSFRHPRLIPLLLPIFCALLTQILYMMQRTMAIYQHQIAATFLQSYRRKYETNQNP
jgi:hypothetical protein